MIISPPRPTQSQGPSMQEVPFLGAIDDDVDSFSTVFTPSIPTSEVSTLTLPISSMAPPILTTKQCKHLGNVFEDFPTLTKGKVS